jgi:hypothetical protein
MKRMKPNDLGKKYLVEQCQKIDFKIFLRKFYKDFKNNWLKYHIEEESGQKIELTTSKTGFNGLRYWFKCPICMKGIGVLYRHPISTKLGCRTCLNLEYRSRKYKGMIENSPK